MRRTTICRERARELLRKFPDSPLAPAWRRIAFGKRPTEGDLVAAIRATDQRAASRRGELA